MPRLEPGKVVLELEPDQHGLPAQLLDNLVERFQLGLVHRRHGAVGEIDRAIGHLRQLGIAGRHVAGLHDALGQLGQHVVFHACVDLALGRLHLQLVQALHQRRQLDIVLGRHLQPIGADLVDDALVGAGQQVVAEPVESDLKIGVAVVRDVAPERRAAVKDQHLPEQVHVAVGRERTGQAPFPLHGGDTRRQRLEPIGLTVLESGQLIDTDHVEGQRAAEEQVAEPAHALGVDEEDIGLPVKPVAQ